MSKPITAGDRFKVKRAAWTKDGIVVSNVVNRQDYLVMPGEIGVIVERQWTAASNGQAMSALFLEFSRGRTQGLSSDGQFFSGDADDYIRL